jgi:hypothetical protein
MMSLLAVGTHLWSFHVVGATQLAGNFGFFGNGGRMQPGVFPAVGVVPVAYALFAFALGSTLGALVRRTTWAAAATFLFYGLALLVVTTTVRPVLAPQYFLPFEGASAGAAAEHLVYGAGNGPAYGGGTQPWLVGLGYRFTPGYHPPAGVPSPDVLGNHCDSQVTDPLACFTTAHVEFGGSYQPASNFWILQWRESAIYAAASVLLLAVGLWAVRRWRA